MLQNLYVIVRHDVDAYEQLYSQLRMKIQTLILDSCRDFANGHPSNPGLNLHYFYHTLHAHYCYAQTLYKIPLSTYT